MSPGKAAAERGDRDPADGRLGTFNALFPKGQYFGELSPIGPRNIVNLHLGVDLDLGGGVSAGMAALSFWRASRGDGLYDLPGQQIRAPGDSRARHVGTQAELSIGWQASAILSVSASLSAFRPGAFIRQTGPARTIRMVGTEAMLKF